MPSNDDCKIVKIWTDGSIKGGNPGGWGVGGFVVQADYCGYSNSGTIDLGKSDTMTNNIAEYSAVVAALKHAICCTVLDSPTEVAIHSDSKLVVEQCNDNWQCSNFRLSQLRDEIWAMCESFDCEVTFTWIPREENFLADEVSRSLYDE